MSEFHEKSLPSLEWLATRLAYEPETGVLTWRKRPAQDFKDERSQRSWNGKNAGKVAGSKSPSDYVRININNHPFLGHRLAWLLTYGSLPTGVIDHVNGDPHDNRLANLRALSHAENIQNQRRARKGNGSGTLGVCREGKRWRARIWVGGQQHGLGTYDSAEQAHEAYVAAKRQLHPGCAI